MPPKRRACSWGARGASPGPFAGCAAGTPRGRRARGGRAAGRAFVSKDARLAPVVLRGSKVLAPQDDGDPFFAIPAVMGPRFRGDDIAGCRASLLHIQIVIGGCLSLA